MVGRYGCRLCICFPVFPVEVHFHTLVLSDDTDWVYRLVTRMTFIPETRTLLVETPHLFRPFSKVRVMSAPVSKLTLSSPLYTGRGKITHHWALNCRKIRSFSITRTISLCCTECSR